MPRSRCARRTVVALIGAVVLGLTPALGVAAVPRVPTPGANGIGDPYWPTDGNGGYDVGHYDLQLSYVPTTDVLRGVATIQARSTQELSRFNLDLDGLTVDSVRVDRVPATWTRASDELQITPATPLANGQSFTVQVGYRGVPVMVDDEFGVSGFYTTGDGAVIAGQPHVADTWFPNNDHPLDKATYRIAITAPANLQAVANGGLGPVTGPGGTRTWTWTTTKPMASYLATMAIGSFQIRRYYSSGVDYLDAIDRGLFTPDAGGTGSVGARAQAALRKQPAIVSFLSRIKGPYPFGQAGGIVDDADIGFALENQTRPVYDPGFFATADVDNDLVVVHELAHQWAGDSVALSRWRDIWLNEGFATYAEWRWLEAQGRDATDDIFDAYAALPSGNSFWALAIGNPGKNNIFAPPVYDRGALTLHALRRLIGEADFAELNRRWFADYAQRNVTTLDFIDLAEEIAGRDLQPFFDAWIYAATKPAGLGARSASSRSAAGVELVERMQARHAKLHRHG